MEAGAGPSDDPGLFAGGLIAALGQLAASDHQEQYRDPIKDETDSLGPPPPAPSPTPPLCSLPQDSCPLPLDNSPLLPAFSSPDWCTGSSFSASSHQSSLSPQSTLNLQNPLLFSHAPPYSQDLLLCSISPSPPPYAACQTEALRGHVPLSSPLFLSPPPYSSSPSPTPPCQSFSDNFSQEPPRRPNSAPPPHSSNPWPHPQPSHDCEFQQPSNLWGTESQSRGNGDLRESILQKHQLVSNPFRPSCVISIPSIKVKTPKKVRFVEKNSLSKEFGPGMSARRKLEASAKGGYRVRSDALEELSLSSLSLVKRKPTLRKSKLTFLGEKYCAKWSDEISREINQTVTNRSPHSAKKVNNATNVTSNAKLSFHSSERKVECSLNMSPWKNMMHGSNKKAVPENLTLQKKCFLGSSDESALENFSKLASKNGGVICKQQSPLNEPSIAKRISNADLGNNLLASSSGSNISTNNSAKGAAIFSQYGTKYRGDPKSRRVLYKLRERRRKVSGLPDGELPNLTGLTIGENCTASCENRSSSAASGGAQCCCGGDGGAGARTGDLSIGSSLSITGSEQSTVGGGVSRTTGSSLSANSDGQQRHNCKCGNCSSSAPAPHARGHKRSTSRNIRSCSEEARREQFEDTTLEELAAYIDNYLYFPKKMSFLAEMMYT